MTPNSKVNKTIPFMGTIEFNIYIYISGLEKSTNANRSVSSISDRLFPVELTEINDWKSISEYMLHSNFGKALIYRREFWCIYLYIAASLFTKYLPIFLDVLSAERISANKLVLFSTTSPLE